jgi:putative transposase
VALKLIYLVVRNLLAWARLSRQDSVAKNVEILMLRHQLAIAQRRTPPHELHRKLSWADRAWMALLAQLLPHDHLARLRLIVTPGTLIRWHRDLLRRRWARRSRRKRPGRPPTHHRIRTLVLRLAKENSSWGYRRIHGELAALGIRVAPSTVWEILTAAGIDPAPRRDRGPSWAQLLRGQADALLAADFVVIDLLDGTKVYVLAVIEHASRRVRVLGATAHPVAHWVVQQARNLMMDLEEADVRARFLIHDRDASFCAAFDQALAEAGTTVIRSAVRAPRMNAIIERWFHSLRAELTDRTLIWNIPHLHRLLREYETFYNQHRPHRALAQAAPLRPLPENVTDLEASASADATAPEASFTNTSRSHRFSAPSTRKAETASKQKTKLNPQRYGFGSSCQSTGKPG